MKGTRAEQALPVCLSFLALSLPLHSSPTSAGGQAALKLWGPYAGVLTILYGTLPLARALFSEPGAAWAVGSHSTGAPGWVVGRDGGPAGSSRSHPMLLSPVGISGAV